MAEFSACKVVASLPGTLAANTLYVVRVGTGVKLFVTNSSGTILAYPIDLGIGTDVQAYSANLDEYAGVNPTAAGLALLDDVDTTAQRTTLGLGTSATESAKAFRGRYGLTISNNATDPTNDIDIAAGSDWDPVNNVLLELTSGMTKRLDASWTVGTGNGGLFSGSKAANATYYKYLIRKASDGSIDAGFDTSPVAANIPSGYVGWIDLGAVMTDGSGVIRPFSQLQNYFYLTTPVLLVNGTAPPTSATLLPVTSPAGVKARAILEVANASVSGDKRLYISSPSTGGLVKQLVALTGLTDVDLIEIATNTSSQISYSANSAANHFAYITSHGWVFPFRSGGMKTGGDTVVSPASQSATDAGADDATYLTPAKLAAWTSPVKIRTGFAQTASFTAAAGEVAKVDLTSANVTATKPAAAAGAWFGVVVTTEAASRNYYCAVAGFDALYLQRRDDTIIFRCYDGSNWIVDHKVLQAFDTQAQNHLPTGLPVSQALDLWRGDTPTSKGYSWVNQGTGSFTASTGEFYAQPASGNGVNRMTALVASISGLTAYEFRLKCHVRALNFINYGASGNYLPVAGLCLRRNSSSKMLSWGVSHDASNGTAANKLRYLTRLRWTNESTLAGQDPNVSIAPGELWLSIRLASGTLYFTYSTDAKGPQDGGTTGATAFEASGFDQIGLMAGNVGSVDGTVMTVEQLRRIA